MSPSAATPEITRQTTSHDKNSFTADAIQDWIKNWLVSKLKIRPEIVVAGKPIIDYGLDSMAAVALILDLENWLGQPLANTLAWNFPSLEEMSQFLAGRHRASVLPSDSTSPETLVEGLDLDAEAVLDPDIRIEGKSFRFIDEPEIALLTGATGFLGSYLLHELLQWTRTTVHCLVRAVDTDTGASRVKKALASLGLWQPSWKDRIKVIVGDLSRPRLGLSSERFLQLAEQVDVIYHCAAEMNFISSYTTQRAVNVSGTRKILRIASKGQVKPVHHVSSFSFVSQAAAHPEKAMGGDEAYGRC